MLYLCFKSLNTKTLKDMSEHDNLQDADGDNLNDTPQEHSTTENIRLLKKLLRRSHSSKSI